MTETTRSRAPRRYVRLRCRLNIGGREVTGVIGNVSATGLLVRLPRASEAVLLEPGSRMEAQYSLLGHGPPIQETVELVWLDPEGHDVAGKATVALGLRFVDPDAQTTERHAEFVRSFHYTVMVVDDEPENLEVLRRVLCQDYRVIDCLSAQDALSILGREEVAVLITDQRMPGMTGLEFLKRVASRYPHAHVVRIVLSAYPDARLVEEFINVGKVFHYIRKPFRVPDLLQIVRRAVDAYAMSVENERLNTELERANQHLQRENAYLRQRVEGLSGFEKIVGNSRKLRKALSELGRIRQSEATVHIQGETGTGKELVARALHFGGPRAERPFVTQNCAGMTETLMQSTLFGHRKGSFTGADRDRPGVFQEADSGTLFLDEVGELSLAVQAALLRALQESEITPVGASRPTKVDVRVISATNRNLREEVKQGRFREDLYFRLVVIAVQLPPLRECVGDIPLLARHFLDLCCERYGKDIPGFTPGAMCALERFTWPGNVRELENEIERGVVLAEDGQKITPELISPHILGDAADDVSASGAVTQDSVRVPFHLSYDDALKMVSRSFIERALKQSEGTVSRAAKMLGIERTRLGKLRQRLGVGNVD